jgi:hypothetical protein
MTSKFRNSVISALLVPLLPVPFVVTRAQQIVDIDPNLAMFPDLDGAVQTFNMNTST